MNENGKQKIEKPPKDNGSLDDNEFDTNKKHKFKQRAIILLIIFTLIIILFTLYSFFGNIPILDRITKSVSFEKRYGIDDKGIELAIKSNFIQDVGITDEYDGLAFTVDNIIIDGRRSIIFYTIENTGDHKYINSLNYEVLDGSGNDVPACKQYPDYGDIDLNKVKKIHDKFSLILSPEFEIPSNIKVEVKIKESQYSNEEYYKVEEKNNIEKSKELPHTWNIEIPINKELFNKKKKISYDINKSVEMEGQKILIDKLTIYPITTVLNIRYDKKNTMKIFSIKDLKLVDGTEEWENGLNGLISSNPDDFTRNFYFESNYFKKTAHELYVTGSGIKCIEKDKLEVIVDMKNSKLLKSPDENLTLREISDNDDSYTIVFEYLDDSLSFDFDFKDAKGEFLHADSIGNCFSGEGTPAEIHYEIPKNLNFISPITLTISDYPNIIDKSFKINVK